MPRSITVKASSQSRPFFWLLSKLPASGSAVTSAAVLLLSDSLRWPFGFQAGYRSWPLYSHSLPFSLQADPPSHGLLSHCQADSGSRRSFFFCCRADP
jgi:hypothetical protein